MRYKILIVDDESAGRVLLKHLATKLLGEKLSVLIQAASFEDAVQQLKNNCFDICLLDIQLSGANSFDLLPFIPENSKIIFVTAYSQYAIRAIKAKAFDYILKPIDPTELQSVFLKIINDEKRKEPSINYFSFKEAGETVPVLLSEIEYIEAKGAYSCIYMTSLRKFTVSKTLKVLSNTLGGDFIRIHKSFVVNRAFVKSYTKDQLFTIGNSCLPVSRIGAKELAHIFCLR